MKRILSILFVLLLILSALPVSAAPAEPEITLQPQNYHYPEYSTAIYTVKATGTNLSATWYLKYEGKTYNISDYTNGVEPWEAYAGEGYGPQKVDANTFTCFFGGIEEELNGAEIWCVLEDGHYEVTSEKAIITVQGSKSPPEILSIPAEVEAYRGDRVEIRCVARSNSQAQLSYTWYETFSGKLQDIKAIMPEEDSDFLVCSTETAGTRYYVCAVTATDGGMVYSSVVPVKVLDADPAHSPEMEILTEKLPDAVVGEEYNTELKCNDPYGLFTLYYNPGRANQLEESGLRITKENYIVGTPVKAGTFTFSVCASGDYGEDYREYTLTVKAPAATEPTQPSEPEETQTQTEPVAETKPLETQPEETQMATEPIPTVGTDHPETEGLPWWGYLVIVILASGIGAAVALLIVLSNKKK